MVPLGDRSLPSISPISPSIYIFFYSCKILVIFLSRELQKKRARKGTETKKKINGSIIKEKFRTKKAKQFFDDLLFKFNIYTCIFMNVYMELVSKP